VRFAFCSRLKKKKSPNRAEQKRMKTDANHWAADRKDGKRKQRQVKTPESVRQMKPARVFGIFILGAPLGIHGF